MAKPLGGLGEESALLLLLLPLLLPPPPPLLLLLPLLPPPPPPPPLLLPLPLVAAPANQRFARSATPPSSSRAMTATGPTAMATSRKE